VGEPIELGNGTEVVVNFSYYDTIKGKGHRLENIRVTKLVEYDRENTETATVKEEVEVKKETKEKKSTISEDLNDKLPW
jgi:predicted GIY-YIG superfamily endonuclease